MACPSCGTYGGRHYADGRAQLSTRADRYPRESATRTPPTCRPLSACRSTDGLLQRALTHRSYAYEHGGLPTNERLEFLGDSVLGLVVTETLFRRHPDLPEGQLAKLRASVVNMRALAAVARELGLGEYVLLGRGEETTGGRDKSSILADTLEAVIGAVYLAAASTPRAGARAPADGPAARGRGRRCGAASTGRRACRSSRGHAARRAGLRRPARGPRPREAFTATAVIAGEDLRRRRRPQQEGGRAAGCRGRLDGPACAQPELDAAAELH